MAMKIMWAAAIFFGGWLFSYLFVRQLAFNFMTAYPMVKKMRALDPELVAPGADKYTNMSVIVCLVVIAIISFVVIRFCKLYLIISFFVGVISALLMFLPKMKITESDTFNLFCSAYSRFVPDDELRTAMFEREPKRMRSRLKELELDSSVIPTFPK